MRCGCRRREDFEGCEPRRGERHPCGPCVSRLRTGCARTPVKRETRRTLVRLRGATDPRPPRGGNRRGGEEPRGRHETRWVGPIGPKGAPAPGSGRAAGMSAGGPTPDGSHERRVRREPIPAVFERSEGEMKSTRASAAPAPVGGAARPPGTPRRPDRRRSKAREEAGKTNDLLPTAVLGQLVAQT